MSKNKNNKLTEKTVRQIVNEELASEIEKKYHDFDTAAVIVPNGGANFYLCNILQGISIGQRIGQVIRGFKLKLRGGIKSGPLATGVVEVRMIVYRDMDQDGDLPVIDDVLEPGIFRSAQQYDYNNTKRYSILLDRRFIIDSANDRYKKFDITLNRTMIINYNASGAGSYQKGAIMVGFVGDATNADNEPTVHMTSRLWYQDA
jgi:hypothetical protein